MQNYQNDCMKRANDRMWREAATVADSLWWRSLFGMVSEKCVVGCSLVARVVKLTSLPESSALHRYVRPGDFVDCYSVVSDLTAREAAEVIVDFPAWVHALIQLRKTLTTPFGLIHHTYHQSNMIGMFPIELETDEEILAGFDDKHLNFRISIAAWDGMIFFATWVRPQNTGGELYLKAVMPFHIMICRNALSRVSTRGH